MELDGEDVHLHHPEKAGPDVHLIDAGSQAMIAPQTKQPEEAARPIRARDNQPPPPSASFACHQCSKSFNRRENLSRHLKTHDIPRAHNCQLCGKTFTRSDLLKRHEAGHERWDKKEESKSKARDEQTKRRRISTDSSVSGSESSPYATAFSPNAGLSSFTANSLNEPIRSSHYQPNFPSIPEKGNVAYYGYEQHQYHYGRRASADNYGMAPPPIFPPFIAHQPGQQDFAQSRTPSADYSSNPGIASYDFSNFLGPDTPLVPGVPSEWFSNDFYDAMQETGNGYDQLQQNFNQTEFMPQSRPLSRSENIGFAVPPIPVQAKTENEVYGTPELSHKPSSADKTPPLVPEVITTAPIERVSSPPNVPSENDKWLFMFDIKTQSEPLTVGPIEIPPDHPLFLNHDPKFDISLSTYMKLKKFLEPPKAAEISRNYRGLFEIPSLDIVNIFIGLYFQHFSPQFPVLHHATTDMNALPPPLVAVIMLIGAMYSRIKNTRRFAIVLQYPIAWNTMVAISADLSLSRNHHIVLSEALVVLAGLWCGNKHAFSMAETFRGQLTSHLRQAYETAVWGDVYREKMRQEQLKAESSAESVNTQWKTWIDLETKRRLCWVVYMVDAQFPVLWNRPSTIGIGEIMNLGVPSDEVFWTATSARNWKNLLGPATEPPSPSFAAAVGRFILPTAMPLVASTSSSSMKRSSRRKEKPKAPEQLPILDLNPWSAFLVLLALLNQVWNFSQESLLASRFKEDADFLTPDSGDTPGSGSGCFTDESDSGGRGTAAESLKARLLHRRRELGQALTLFSTTYLPNNPPSHLLSNPTSSYFYTVSKVLVHLGSLLLHVSFSDLQNAVGKMGQFGIQPAMNNLRLWAREEGDTAVRVAGRAVMAIVELGRIAPRASPSGSDDEDAEGEEWEGMREAMEGEEQTTGDEMVDTAGYGVITLMLSYIILWAFVQVADEGQRNLLLENIPVKVEGKREEDFLTVLKEALIEPAFMLPDVKGKGREEMFEGMTMKENERARKANQLFRSAAESLVRFGTWGISLDVAMLLHRRAEG